MQKTIPEWAKSVQMGDVLSVKAEYIRCGQRGEVISDPNAHGVSLDFYCDSDGDEDGAPTQEFWEWDELELPSLTTAH